MMTRGEKVITFIENFCLVPEGRLVGKPMRLSKFQKRFILAIYDNPSGTRRAILSLARKNGKTALIAAMLLAHIVGPLAEQNSQLVSGAMSREQASLVYKLAAKMLDLQPLFAHRYRSVPSTKTIVGLSKNVEFKALSAEGSTAHGLSPIVAILDEAGQVRGPMTPFIEAIITSQGAHENPLLIVISTQAPSDADMLSVWIDDAERSGDPHTVCHVYAADKDCDILDQTQWAKANPGLGDFRSERDLEEQIKMASRIPSMEASARNLLLNQRVALDSLWLAPSVWKENGAPPIIDVFREGAVVSVGLDLSKRTDLTAAVFAARDQEGAFHLLPFVFTPQQGIADRELRDKAPYSLWVKQGKLIAVPGATLDYRWLFEFMRQKTESLGIEASIIAFDRWRINEAKDAALAVDVFSFADWREVGQGYKDMAPRVEAFESLLLQGMIRHGNHPLLNMAAANAIAVSDPAGNRKLDKAKSTLRIDPLVAAVMAVGALSIDAAAFDPAAFVS